MSANTRIAASATALVLAAVGLTACNDSEGATDTTGVNPSDAITSEDPVSGGSSSGTLSDSSAGGSSAGGSSVGGSSADGSVSDGSAGGAVSGGSSAGGSSVGGSGDSGLGSAEVSDSPLGGAEAPEQVDPLSPQMTP